MKQINGKDARVSYKNGSHSLILGRQRKRNKVKKQKIWYKNEPKKGK